MKKGRISVEEYHQICEDYSKAYDELELMKLDELKKNESKYMENAFEIYTSGKRSFEADLIEVRLRLNFPKQYQKIEELRDRVIANVNNVDVPSGVKEI